MSLVALWLTGSTTDESRPRHAQPAAMRLESTLASPRLAVRVRDAYSGLHGIEPVTL